MIRLFYKAIDFLFAAIIFVLVDKASIDRVIRAELIGDPDGDLLASQSLRSKIEDNEGFTNHMNLIHSRVSSLISHISIMIGLMLFSLTIFEKGQFPYYVILGELVFYLFIAVICLRCMRSYGFEYQYKDDEYIIQSFEDITLRFSLYRIANFLTIVGTLIFIAILLWNGPSV